MLFNSFTFALFLPFVFCFYWSLQKKLQVQNFFLLIVSYVFYGWWDWRFLILIALSSLVDFLVGLKLGQENSERVRKYLLGCSLGFNLCILCFFKYCNFFIDSFVTLFSSIGVNTNITSLNIILPVGISFYTFQSLSYTIDIYRRRLKPVSSSLQYFVFVSFFPQLVAGPIERAANLLPQFGMKRNFDRIVAAEGLRRILWGLLKKMVIADQIAPHVDLIFVNYTEFDGIRLLIGLFLFSIQIYCDFSGYSDIAIGSSSLLGIKLSRNFAYPYFARNVSEFWRRWHISLSTWFRDYVYIPLGGNRCALHRQGINILATFALSGFWHGANWTFITWGVLHSIYLLPIREQWPQKSPGLSKGIIPSLREFLAMLATFSLVMIAWVFFRAETLTDAWYYLARITGTFWDPAKSGYFRYAVLSGLFLLIVEWIFRHKEHPLAIGSWPSFLRWPVYYSVIWLILWKGNFGYTPFIYFQF